MDSIILDERFVESLDTIMSNDSIKCFLRGIKTVNSDQEATFMAIPVIISDLINSRIVESSRVEFKADWNPEPILHTICAFASDIDNMGGGYIVVGVCLLIFCSAFPL